MLCASFLVPCVDFHSKMAAREDLNRQLFDAVTRNDVETSLSLLDNGADANASVALFGRKVCCCLT